MYRKVLIWSILDFKLAEETGSGMVFLAPILTDTDEIVVQVIMGEALPQEMRFPVSIYHTRTSFYLPTTAACQLIREGSMFIKWLFECYYMIKSPALEKRL